MGSWGAQARERVLVSEKAAVETAPPKPEPKKEFKNDVELFPELPLGAPIAAKGKAKAKSKADPRAKAKGEAKTKVEVKPPQDGGWDAPIEPAPEPEETVELVPDDQLVLIHDPLEAVALTEAAERERKAKAMAAKNAAKKGSRRKAPLAINPWIA